MFLGQPDLGPVCGTPPYEASLTQDHLVPHPAPLSPSQWLGEAMEGQLQQLEAHRRSHIAAQAFCCHEPLETFQFRLQSFNIPVIPLL